MGDRFAWIFRGAGKLEGLGPVECCCTSYFAGFLAVDLCSWVRNFALQAMGHGELEHTPLDTALAAALALALCFPPMGAIGDSCQWFS